MGLTMAANDFGLGSITCCELRGILENDFEISFEMQQQLFDFEDEA